MWKGRAGVQAQRTPAPCLQVSARPPPPSPHALAKEFAASLALSSRQDCQASLPTKTMLWSCDPVKYVLHQELLKKPELHLL